MKTKIIVMVAVLVLAGAGIWYWQNGQMPSASPTPTTSPSPTAHSLEYRNDQFGFYIPLPDSWKGYTVINGQWEGRDIATGKVTEQGPLITLRHPLYTVANPREDMPVMVFTTAQWKLVQQEKLSVGAAPIPPSVLGQNSKYVLALPARYNYDFKTGWEEVDQIVHRLKAYEPPGTQAGAGTLSGHVTIGPICPVEQAGHPCTPSPETYTAHEFVVLDGSQKEVTRFYAGADGNYSIALSAGTYTVTTAKTGFGYTSKDLPSTVVIKSGQTVILNISIDTGIR